MKARNCALFQFNQRKIPMMKNIDSSASDVPQRADQEVIASAKRNAIRLALEQSRSRVVDFKALALVDLQGIYLRLHEVLSGINFPIERGEVIGKLGLLQINEVFSGIARSVQKRCASNVGLLSDLHRQIKVEVIDGRPRLAEELLVIQDGIYLDVYPSFEVFYAIPPLGDIKWRLEKEAKNGSREARSQLEKLGSGRVRTALFERDYRYFGDFVETIKASSNCQGSQQGFFAFSVGSRGVERFDEKEVDARIAIRAMEALYEKQAEALCIVSSDQDFIPIKQKCEKFGVQFFQADAAKFMDGARVGRKIEDLSDNFIRGTLRPEWPLAVLCDFIEPGEGGSYWLVGISASEARALASFHNAMNEYKLKISIDSDGRVSLVLSRPLVATVETRVDGRTKMNQVQLGRLEY